MKHNKFEKKMAFQLIQTKQNLTSEDIIRLESEIKTLKIQLNKEFDHFSLNMMSNNLLMIMVNLDYDSRARICSIIKEFCPKLSKFGARTYFGTSIVFRQFFQLGIFDKLDFYSNSLKPWNIYYELYDETVAGILDEIINNDIDVRSDRAVVTRLLYQGWVQFLSKISALVPV